MKNEHSLKYLTDSCSMFDIGARNFLLPFFWLENYGNSIKYYFLSHSLRSIHMIDVHVAWYVDIKFIIIHCRRRSSSYIELLFWLPSLPPKSNQFPSSAVILSPTLKSDIEMESNLLELYYFLSFFVEVKIIVRSWKSHKSVQKHLRKKRVRARWISWRV